MSTITAPRLVKGRSGSLPAISEERPEEIAEGDMTKVAVCIIAANRQPKVK
jgi:hypothetical protein